MGRHRRMSRVDGAIVVRQSTMYVHFPLSIHILEQMHSMICELSTLSGFVGLTCLSESRTDGSFRLSHPPTYYAKNVHYISFQTHPRVDLVGRERTSERERATTHTMVYMGQTKWDVIKILG